MASCEVEDVQLRARCGYSALVGSGDDLVESVEDGKGFPLFAKSRYVLTVSLNSLLHPVLNSSLDSSVIAIKCELVQGRDTGMGVLAVSRDDGGVKV